MGGGKTHCGELYPPIDCLLHTPLHLSEHVASVVSAGSPLVVVGEDAAQHVCHAVLIVIVRKPQHGSFVDRDHPPPLPEVRQHRRQRADLAV